MRYDHSEDERTSDDSSGRTSPSPADAFYSYERAGGFTHDQSVYGEPECSIPRRKPLPCNDSIVPEREKLVPFVNIWPDLGFCDHE
eukprot:5733570-Pleurochrysis_carterae.AAC.1